MQPGREIRRGRRAAPLVAIIVAATLGCGKDSTGTGPSLSGTFALTAIDNAGLPVARPFGIGSEKIMLSGQLQFLSRGRLLEIREIQTHVFATNQYLPAETDSVAYSYRLAADTLFVLHTALDVAAAYTDTGYVSGGDAIFLQVRGKPGDLFSGEFLYGRTQ
jgi:hypothetical protein